MRQEAEEPQDAEVVLTDTGVGVADEDHAARDGVGQSLSGGIVNPPIGVSVERVHREIAPSRVLGPVRRKGDDRPPTVRLYVFSKGGDLERPSEGDGGDGAMIEARRLNPQTVFGETLHHLIRRQTRGDVEIEVGRVPPEQRVPHTTADEPGGALAALLRQSGHDRLRRAVRHPGT
jgi:hypothetical protein